MAGLPLRNDCFTNLYSVALFRKNNNHNSVGKGGINMVGIYPNLKRQWLFKQVSDVWFNSVYITV